jgi:glucosamine--fructose-6-phosphate aminotransferase (isomerizing)
MCGIFGFSGNSKIAGSELQLIKNLLMLSESRGKEACGLAIDGNSEIKFLKAPIPASDLIKTPNFNGQIPKAIEADFKTVIGHSRLVTNGYEQDNNNNQPVVKNGIVAIHNGIIVNDKELWNVVGQGSKKSELDTELIPTLIHHNLKTEKSIIASVQKMYSQIEGIANVALLFEDRKELLLATNNGSLYYVSNEDNSLFIFSSERHILSEITQKFKSLRFDSNAITHLKPNTILVVDNKLEKQLIAFEQKTELDLKSCGVKKITEIKLDLTKPAFRNTSMEYHFESIPAEFENEYSKRNSLINNLKRCSKCLLPETFPNIVYDQNGVCSYCNNHVAKKMKTKEELVDLLSNYKSATNDKPDCVIPFSGGRDSSYVMHFVKKELGMNPIAFSYDWGMLTDLSRRNQSRMCSKLGIEHILVSADIRKKRNFIKLNVEAWLHKPHLGTIPLFMAGDKHYFYYNHLIMKQNDLKVSIMGENHLEKTGFKTAFSGAKQDFNGAMAYNVSSFNKLKMMGFYGSQFITNPKYINASLLDTATAFLSYYGQKHDYLNLFDFIEWDEKTVEDTILGEYNWELDPYTKSTWRIGDGTAAFYNYIYYMVAGFTENDTFRSNQIREGKITREEALKKVQEENYPRWESIQWYCNTIRLDWKDAVKIINKIKPHYG